jgi:excinuclease ABC subunit A
MDTIRIRGARTHNLKSIDLDLPRERLIVFTGLSGSGKSSLAFDTIYAEGQRRYVESLSSYARQFLSVMEKPDLDHIEGLSPAISIEQKTTSHNPRSTVGTITEIYDYLRLLFARVGQPRCPAHDEPLEAQTISQMVDQVMALPEGERLMLLAPVVSARKGEYQRLIAELHAQGFVRARIDGDIYELDDPPELDIKKKHDIEVVVDRFRVRPDLALRLAESFETALKLSGGIARVAAIDDPERPMITFSASFACPVCGYSIPELEPRIFSFNNPVGACPTCDGLGMEQFFDPAKVVLHPDLSLAGGAVRGWDRRNAFYFQVIRALGEHYGFDVETPWNLLDASVQHLILFGTGKEKIKLKLPHERGSAKVRPFEGIIRNMERRYKETDSNTVREELARYLSHQPCPACGGSRLNEAARHVFLDRHNLPTVAAMPVGDSLQFFEGLELPGKRGEIGARVIKEVATRLRFLVDVGLDYLTLDRSAETLSGGEAQRIRLASQIGAGLVGVMYILDEPSIGLHQRDNARLLKTLNHLRDIGNTVIVVEHDEEAIRSADLVVDLGPGAGVHGGEVVAQGTADEIAAAPGSLTGRYLCGDLRIVIPTVRTANDPSKQLRILGARGNNLRAVDAEIPVGSFVCITGVSGSGKSTLINDTLYPLAARHLNGSSLQPAPHTAIEGLDQFDKVVDIDQSPIGRTPRSNPATYTGLFNLVRDLFAAVPEARSRGYGPGRFSFNVKGGRCEACKGRWTDSGRDALPAGHLCPVRHLQGPALQPRDTRDPLQGQDHRRGAEPHHRGCARVLRTRAPDQAQAPDPDGRRPGLRAPRPERHHALRRRGPAREAQPRAQQARHRPNTLYPRRTHYRPALSRRQASARRPAPLPRPRQHRGRDRAQPRRHQDRGLDHRPGAGGRTPRRRDHRRRDARADCREPTVAYRTVFEAVAGAGVVRAGS